MEWIKKMRVSLALIVGVLLGGGGTFLGMTGEQKEGIEVIGEAGDRILESAEELTAPERETPSEGESDREGEDVGGDSSLRIPEAGESALVLAAFGPPGEKIRVHLKKLTTACPSMASAGT